MSLDITLYVLSTSFRQGRHEHTNGFRAVRIVAAASGDDRRTSLVSQMSQQRVLSCDLVANVEAADGSTWTLHGGETQRLHKVNTFLARLAVFVFFSGPCG